MSLRFFKLLSFLLIATPAAFAVDLHSPEFESLEEAGIRKHLKRSPVQAYLFLAENAFAEDRIHEAREFLDAASDICEGLQDYANTAYSCALVETERLIHSQWAWGKQAISDRIERFLALAQKGGEGGEAKLYAEGRIFGTLPRGQGRQLGKSLVALESLKRLRPEYRSTYYWLAEVERLAGQTEAMEESLSHLRKHFPNDKRLRGFERRRKFRTMAPRYGIVPGIFVDPASGFGGVVNLFDDRLWDTMRMGDLTAWGSTRGNFGGSAKFTDFETWEGIRVTLETKGFVGEEDFFGLGIDAPKTAWTELKTNRFSGKLLFTQWFLPTFYLTIGWRGQAFHREAILSGPLNPVFPQSTNSFHSGAVGELGFDTRDPASGMDGVLLSFGGYFPVKDVASSSTFRRWEFVGSWQRAYSKYLLSASAQAVHTTGDVPFDSFPRLAGDLIANGIRRNRYADGAAYLANVELQREVAPTVRAGLYGNVGTVAPELSKLFSVAQKAGGGASVELGFGQDFSQALRFDGAVFGNEWIFSILASTRL